MTDDQRTEAEARIGAALPDDVLDRCVAASECIDADGVYDGIDRQTMRHVLSKDLAPLLVAAEQRAAQAEQVKKRIGELARKEHDLCVSIAEQLQKIGQINDAPNANITSAIHGVIQGYASYRHDYKHWRERAESAERAIAARGEPGRCPDCGGPLAICASCGAEPFSSPASEAPWSLEMCRDCDGCGWTEGGPTLKTTCRTCDGTGQLTKAQKRAEQLALRRKLAHYRRYGSWPASPVIGKE